MGPLPASVVVLPGAPAKQRLPGALPVPLVPGAPHCLHLPLLHSHPSLKTKGWGGRQTGDSDLLCDPRQAF